jgi:hypothetical protein
VVYVAGKVGAKALSFNGVDGYVQIPLSISNDFSIAFWAKTTATGGGAQWWAGKGLVDGEVAGSGADFGTALVGNNFGFGIGTPDTTIVSTTAINDGYWHHLTATRQMATGQMKIYVDGVLEASGTGDVTPRTLPPSLRIGSIQTGVAAGFLAGTLDDVRLYNYVLSATQIGALANTAPNLAPIADRSILAGRTLAITNSATDAEAPPQVLTFSLASPPPSGVNLNGANGILTWRPTMAQAGTTNVLRVVVSDSGTPSLSATQSFSVAVGRPVQPGLGGASVSNGQFRLQISGDSGLDYTVQGSTNLLDWTSLWTTNPPALPFPFVDASSTNYFRRFYRVLLGP